MKAKHLALVGIASAFLWASTANSATVTIGAAPGAGPLPAPITVASSPLGADIVLVRLRVPQRFGAYLTRTKSLLPAGL